MGSNVTKSTTPQNTLVCKKKKKVHSGFESYYLAC